MPVLNEAHNKTPTAVWVKLRALMDEHPDAKIVSTADASGYEAELFAVTYDEKANKIELVFD